MSLQKKIKKSAECRADRVRAVIKKNTKLLRVSVFRSLNHIYAQIIDDNAHKTIISCSSVELKNLKGDKKKIAHSVGLELGTRAKTKGISSVVFDRGPFLYHGRVKALAEGAREKGLNF